MTNTQKTKKLRKNLQVYDREPNGKYDDVDDEEDQQLETYDAEDNMENENDLGYEMNEDPVTQALNEYKLRKNEMVYYPSSGDNVEEINYSQNVNDPDSSKTREGQAFGFIRNKFDDASDNYKNKLESKSRAYEDYLNMKPKTMTGNDSSTWNKFDMFLGKVSGTAKRIGAIGGSRSPESVVGIRGSVLGPFPRSVTQSDMQQGNIGRFTNMPDVQRNIQGGYIPEKFMQPGMPGAQVPKYQYSPRTANPGTTWQRVVTVDQYGKKRSALRKVRVPDMQYNRVPMQQQEEPGLYNRNPLGVGFRPENLGRATATGVPGLDQNMNSLINAIKSGGANNIQQRSTALTSNSGINFNKDLGMYLR